MTFKTKHGRIPIDPPILAAIGHRLIHSIKRKKERKKTKKCCRTGLGGNARGDEKPDTFFGPKL